MSPGDDVHSVAVVGAGIGGAAIARLLAGLGYEVMLVERTSELGPVGSGLLLQPSGQRALVEMGLLEEIRSQSAPIGEVLALSPRGRELVRLRYDELGDGVCAYGVRRAVLFDALVRGLREAGVRIELGIEIVAAEEGAGGVSLVAADGARLGPFDLVVGTDGSRSRLRRFVSPRSLEHGYRWGALWGMAECEPVGGRLHQVLQGTRFLVGLLPVGAGNVNFFWSVHHVELDRLRARGFPRFREQVLKLCPLAEEPLTQLDSFESLSVAGYRHVWRPVWHRGRVVLLGDAAHAMSPHLGQGVNLALADALALRDGLEAGKTYEEALRLYAARRRAQTRYYSRVTFMLTPFFQSNGRAKGWLRDLGLPVLARSRRARRKMTVAMAGLASGLWREDPAKRGSRPSR